VISRLWLIPAQLREERKADLERHVQAVNSLLEEAELPHEDSSNDEEDVDWAGIKEPPAVIDHEAEYEDEDRHTTVTIEAVDVTRDGLQKATEVSASEEEEEPSGEKGTAVNSATGEAPTQKVKRIWTKEKPQGPKKKKKKFRYESKVERKATRFKERSANKAKAKARRE
jgi:ribosomal RNA-processing protein 17